MEKGSSKIHIKWIAQAGVFTALAVALGYLLVFIPNIELISSTIFVSGWLFGPSVGITVGCMSFAIFSLFNPLGAAMPPLLLAQIMGGALIGSAGYLFKIFLTGLPIVLKMVMVGVGAGFITLIFDIITNIAGFIAFTTEKTFLAYLSAGIIFSILHIVSNILIFSLILFPVLQKVEKLAINRL